MGQNGRPAGSVEGQPRAEAILRIPYQRLLDASGLKRRLLRTTEPLALVVSEEIYRSIVSQGYAGIDRQDFTSTVWVRVGDQRHRGWVQAPRAPAAGIALPEIGSAAGTA